MPKPEPQPRARGLDTPLVTLDDIDQRVEGPPLELRELFEQYSIDAG
jgi:hypothetical protein